MRYISCGGKWGRGWEGFLGIGSTHRNSLGSQSQQVLPKIMRGPFMIFIQLLKGKRLMLYGFLGDSKQQIPQPASVYTQAFLDYAGHSQAHVYSHSFHGRGGWLTWTWAWSSMAVFRIPSSALITAVFRAPLLHSKRSACSARAIIIPINSST